jgi:hypothetical protein
MDGASLHIPDAAVARFVELIEVNLTFARCGGRVSLDRYATRLSRK